MSNSKTEHSKLLRKRTSADWQSANLSAANRLEIRCKDSSKISDIRVRLSKIEGASMADKIIYLLDFYERGL